jgi:hypothetical protein
VGLSKGKSVVVNFGKNKGFFWYFIKKEKKNYDSNVCCYKHVGT